MIPPGLRNLNHLNYKVQLLKPKQLSYSVSDLLVVSNLLVVTYYSVSNTKQ